MAISTGLRLSALVFVLAFALTGCGGSKSDPDPTPPQVADLIMTLFSAPATGTAGASISVSDTVSNSGNGAAGAFQVGIYLSTNNIISTGDILLGTRSLTSLAAGASSNGSGTLTIPSTVAPGSYFVGAIADHLNAVGESNENNNVASTVVPITIAGGSFPDLSTTAFTAPGTGTAGATISVNTTVTNVGVAAAGAFQIGIYLSTNNTISTGDTLIGTKSVSSLAVGATNAGAANATLPANLAAGTYFLGAIADHADAVAESNETNNISTAATIVISGAPSVDLAVTAFTAPSSGTSGSTITISDTVTNIGSATAGAFEVGVYLSTDSSITTSDTLIATRSVSSLGAGLPSSASGTVTIPSSVAAGSYFIGIIADRTNAVSETNESNNVSNPVSISIASGGTTTADLRMTAFTAPSTGVSGSTISISDTVTNSGTGAAGPFFVGIYLSTNNVITTTDTAIAFRDISGGLAAGASSTGSGTVTLPSGLTAGTYFLGAIADDLNEVNETNEANNVSTVVTITISASSGGACADAFEQDDTQATAKPISVGQTQTRNHCDDAVDWVSFSATAGTTYTLETFMVGVDADTVLTLFGTTGTQLAQHDDKNLFGGDFGSRITFTATQNGTHTVRIDSFASFVGPNTGYTFRLTSP